MAGPRIMRGPFCGLSARALCVHERARVPRARDGAGDCNCGRRSAARSAARGPARRAARGPRARYAAALS